MTRIKLTQPFVPAETFRTYINAKAHYSPKVNIVETSNNIQLELAVPGIKKDAISIKYDNGKLNISYEGKEETIDRVNYMHREFSAKPFAKSFSVSAKKINTEEIEAKYENGILTLVLPKREDEKVQPAMQIAVS